MSIEQLHLSNGFHGFTEADFEVFSVPGLEARMESLKENLRPKLNQLGELLLETVSSASARPMFAHVAKHARRTTNPPNDSWVAFSENARGYKKWPTYMIGAWSTHVFVQFGMIYESSMRSEFARHAAMSYREIKEMIPEDYCVFLDYTKPLGQPIHEFSEESFKEKLLQAANKSQGDLLFGTQLPRSIASTWSGERTLSWIKEAVMTLAPLYEYAKERGMES